MGSENETTIGSERGTVERETLDVSHDDVSYVDPRELRRYIAQPLIPLCYVDNA